eukprot:m.239742 g.239742  ORF g.239742 m.239742 type:complete len:800 (-) comp14013_c0_seq1:142-2541(-)
MGEEDELLVINVDGRQPRKSRRGLFDNVWTLVVVTVVLLSLGGGLGIGFLGRAFSKLCSDKCAAARQYEGCFDALPFIGVVLVVFVSPLGVLGFGSLVVQFANRVAIYGRTAMISAVGGLTAVAVSIMIASWVLLLKPKTTFVGRPDGSNENDPLLVLIGGFIMIAFTALSISCGTVLFEMLTFKNKPISYSNASLTPRGIAQNWKQYVTALCLFAICAFCNATFSSVWNYSAKSYFPATSEYAVVQVAVHNVTNSTEMLVFKLYEDTIVYYSFMGVIATIGFCVHLVPSIRRLLHSRIVVPRSLKKWFLGGISLGESIFVFSILVLYIYWIWFWRWGYDRIYNETGPAPGMPAYCCGGNSSNATCTIPADEYRELQTWARVMGHITSLTMSLLILPVARNSLWDYVFGVPFERALQYHRVLGVLAYTLLTVHMLLWYIKWGIEKTLANNLFTLDYLQITPDNIHFDNFTIILNELTWLLVTVMVFIALFKRRNNYKLFYYTHQFAIIFYIVALFHAWTFWYYAVGGLMLWLIDRCIRIVRRSQLTVVRDEARFFNAGVTMISVEKQGFSFYPGQYAWVCVPSISEFDWHPFTISAPPSSGQITFHIKNMGPDTFTNKLFNLDPNVMHEVRVDGPYGRPLYFDECENLLLIAGGIGITPMYSIISEIFLRASANQDVGNIKKVKLVWVARNREVFYIFHEMLTYAQNRTNVEFNCELYVTDESGREESFSTGSISEGEVQEIVGRFVQQGRPDLQAVSKEFPFGQSTMMMTCGPEGLISASSDVAAEFDFLFHHEVFNF